MFDTIMKIALLIIVGIIAVTLIYVGVYGLLLTIGEIRRDMRRRKK